MGLDYDGGSDGQSDGEGNTEKREKRPTGPWQQQQGEGNSQNQQQQQQETQKPAAAPISNVYVPPALKNQVKII